MRPQSRFTEKQQKVMEAIAAQNSGHHTKASQLFQDAGNAERPIAEKRELWKAAERARRIAGED